MRIAISTAWREMSKYRLSVKSASNCTPISRPFAIKRSMLLGDGEEMRVSVAMGEDDGLATECADFCATDIKYVAVLGEVG